MSDTVEAVSPEPAVPAGTVLGAPAAQAAGASPPAAGAQDGSDAPSPAPAYQPSPPAAAGRETAAAPQAPALADGPPDPVAARVAEAEQAAADIVGRVEAVAAVVGEQAGNVEAEAAKALAAAYKEVPGVVQSMIAGETVADVKATFQAAKDAYAAIRASILAEFGAAAPAGHAGQGAPPAPSDPLQMIAQGIKAGK